MTQAWEAKPRVLLDAMGVFHWVTLNNNTYMKFFLSLSLSLKERESMGDGRTKSKATEKRMHGMVSKPCRGINHHADTKQWQLDTYVYILFCSCRRYFSTPNIHMYLYMTWIPSSLRATIRLLCQWWEVSLSPFHHLYLLGPLIENGSWETGVWTNAGSVVWIGSCVYLYTVQIAYFVLTIGLTYVLVRQSIQFVFLKSS